MRLVIQRVSEASVTIGGEVKGRIGRGIVVLAGFGQDDREEMVPKIADKLIGLRIFADGGGNTNLALSDVKGGILLISQFTLYADIRKGRRPSFTDAMGPGRAEELYGKFVEAVRQRYFHGPVETGEFGAMMDVGLVNEGPVTIWLDSRSLNIS